MKQLPILILGLSCIILLQAKEININKATGIEQSTITSLSPNPLQLDVNADITPKAIFSVVLDPKHLKKNDITLKHITQSKESFVPGQVSYQNNVAFFDPDENLKEGYYEITYKSLKPLKTNKESKIKEIKYRFYVPEVINGYKLPPEPDKALNNSTLLGVDSNDNGVRDDVERYIIKTYRLEKIAVEIGFQVARAYNAVIEDPANAEETYKVLDAAIDCEGYFRVYAKLFKEDFYLENEIDSKSFQSMNLNTKERITAYLTYDRALSGGVYDSTKIKDMKKNCAFDIEQMLKDRK